MPKFPCLPLRGAALAFMSAACFACPAALPTMPVGLNLTPPGPFSEAVFVDLMKTVPGWGLDAALLDTNGYPLEVPSAGVREISVPLCERGVAGTYVILYDGEGDINFGYGCARILKREPGRLTVDYKPKAPGQCSDGTQIRITRSVRGNHLRNIRMIPVGRESTYLTQPFDERFLQMCRPFHCLRFMDWLSTNGSTDGVWERRRKPTHYTQCGTTSDGPDPFLRGGVCHEHIIELCNLLRCDAWICVPHRADDNYILRMAELYRDRLAADLRIYLEYSNELWNWAPGFPQCMWLRQSREGIPDSLLVKLRATSLDFEWNAIMMARVFSLWSKVFGADMKRRVVRVGSVQHGWPPNTRVLLNYLSRNGGCDAVSPAGYFGACGAARDWLKSQPASSADPAQFLARCMQCLPDNEWKATRETGAIAREFGVDYICYEGGQHINPMGEGRDRAFWDCQILPQMYDAYIDNFRVYAEPGVNCRLFVAFASVGGRESPWGSWGHLETLDQLADPSRLKTIAPKYQALLDVNAPRTTGMLPRAAGVLPAPARAGAVRGLVLRSGLHGGKNEAAPLYDARGRRHRPLPGRSGAAAPAVLIQAPAQ